MSVLVGKQAPRFAAKAVIDGNKIVEGFSLQEFLGKKNVVLFFYPADFTFVCPTEIIAFQEKLEEFKKRDTVVVGVSVDSEFSHWKWLQTPRNEGGIKGVTFPLVADPTLTISKNYDVLAGDFDYDEEGSIVFEGNPQAYRGLFLIDKQGVVRHQVVNDMPLGRSVAEVLRVVDALAFFLENGEVCPANWHKGDKGLAPTQEGISSYLAGK
ncbi:MAG: redoxin domain-containing protein [Odoribacteraceae bacterium]|jgi:peroxiredoxin (alkyl hydroperoxide reductase subunit C)|nr:redoxin domain-containing protein [Odoribacteraceae bacterium]